MSKLEKIKNMWDDVYSPEKDVSSVILNYFHPEYKQCINGVFMSRPEYIDHVIAQKKNMTISHIEYLTSLENGEELFAIYKPKGKTMDGSDIEAEVISHFLFKGDQIIKIHGQVRLIKGSPADVDMQNE